MRSPGRSPLLIGICLSAAALAAADGPDGGTEAGTPVVLELFTSQGCSSCPPADRLLTRLGTTQPLDGVEVIPLSFHVDYWNYIGWTDPFSAERWSERQRRYARVMRLDTIYTPQIVIQGRGQVVGSSADQVLREISQARTRGVTVAVAVEVTSPAPDRLVAEVEARIERALPAHGVELWVALFEERLITPVSRGENAARTLENDFVVRRFEPAFAIDGTRGGAYQGSVTFRLEPGWQRERLGVAVLAQDPVDLEIYGAARAEVR